MLEKTVLDPMTQMQKEISYTYNFANQRIGKKSDKEEIRYLTDITRDHYNLLAESINGERKTFVYDDNVVSFEKEGTRSYYQTDELGSTMYLTGTDGAAYSPYAYDPFGNRIHPKTGRKNTTTRHDYTVDGNIIQPFAFTGYREEESGLYYAQARNYDPISGRFAGEDKVRGMIPLPDTQNHYLYCLSNPIILVDTNGLWPTILVGAIGGAIVGAVSYGVGAAISGDFSWSGLAGATAGGAVVGGMMGAGIEDPRALGAAYAATSSFVSGTVETAQTVYEVAKSGGTKEEILKTAGVGMANTVINTAASTVVGAGCGMLFEGAGKGAIVGVGAAVRGGATLFNEVTDKEAGIRWGKVVRNFVAGGAEAYTAVTGFGGLKAGLDKGKSVSDAIKITGRNIKTSVGADVAAIKQGAIKVAGAIKQGVINGITKLAPAMGNPPPGEVIGEGCSGENGSNSNLDSNGNNVKNWKGEEVKIPEGHKMSPRDPDFSAKPITEEGPYTSEQREDFLNGNSSDTKLAPHHRHQIPVRDGGVIDELPGPGHPSGNQHTSGSPSRHPAKSIFNSEPGGNTLRSDETSQHWIDKGNRLIEVEPGIWIDPGF
ncbi:MAG: hypothetical protein J6I58_08960 [Eubacterium sp.]|nr:hypothetical protein [Butyrivibrio sp.]MBP3719634.1 hypothetical protein [Eubacterium sp.]